MKAYEIKPNGFCNGVIRAIKMINKIVEDPNTPLPIYMFGYLVHNKKIINGFIENHNIILIKDDFANTLTNIKKGTVIFTAHGISPKIKQIAINNNLNIIDTTCPNVLKIQNKIKEKINDNYKVIVIGNNNHPEVMGYLGIDSNIEMFDESLAFNNFNKIFVINQTTLIYDDILNKFKTIKSINKDAEVVEEICTATKVRQKALIDNLDNFDCFIIVGDKLSSNCNSLYKIALTKKPSFLIESVEELNTIDLSKFKSIGITAGASTPSKITLEIINQINSNQTIFKSNLNSLDLIKV